MGKFVLYLTIHGYDKANELRTCVTTEASSTFEASVLEETATHTLKYNHSHFEELYMGATLVHNNNEVMYRHDYQLI